MIKFEIDGRGLLRPVLHPLICTVVYGTDTHYACLNLLLQSLVDFGKYNGQVAIFCDRSSDCISRYLPDRARSQILHVPLRDVGLTGRYSIADHDLHQYSPIMYLDNDIVINNDIMVPLSAIAIKGGISVTTEAEFYTELSSCKISEISDVRRVGNWFGLEMCRIDPSCSEDLLPMANSGIMGFRDHDTFRLISGLVRDLYRHPIHSDVAKYFTDQPFLNYALVKTRVGEYEILRKACSFLGTWDPFPEQRRGFVHFIWARGEDKPRRMERYLAYLNDVGTMSLK
jgi:hypothetical protein